MLKNPRSLLLFNKPFRVLTQFTSTDGKANLSDYVSAPRMRPAGRLDYDSEGLVLLTDSGALADASCGSALESQQGVLRAGGRRSPG